MSLLSTYLIDRNIKCFIKAIISKIYPKAYIRGTNFCYIHNILSNFEFYREYLQGAIKRDELRGQLMGYESELKKKGLSERHIHVASRFPADEEKYVDTILLDLKKESVIETVEYGKDDFNEYRKIVYSQFDHSEYQTHIYPEEERIAYALTQIVKPRSIIVMGSYYGYWAIWAMPAVKDMDGIAHFVDIDKNVCRLAQRNLQQLGYGNLSRVIIGDAIEFMANHNYNYDYAVLDANGGQTHDNPDYQGKSIYYPMIKEFCKHIEKSAIVLCHNIMIYNHFNDIFYKSIIQKNLYQYRKFEPFVRNNFSICVDYPTTEGIGIYKV